ncbi:MAG: hypothetical protein F4023_08600 [Acidobacteria bacterium]|nr:hypothetical protein [Acidobacteriota bacterium]MYH20765.1 hypothetical protein [Acidobacteriota bacterium]MYK79695.1 hypothetical protein [Acidobacteriota bacterium]
MSVEIADAPNVNEKLRVLGCHEPRGLAVLPVNLDAAPSREELLLGGEAETIEQLLRAADLTPEDVFAGQRPPSRLRKHLDWDGGMLFVGTLANIATIVSAFEAIMAHLRKQFPRGGRSPNVRLDVRIETTPTGSSKNIRFEGPAEKLSELPCIIRKIRDVL